jgi:hypothetical protein
MPLKIQETTTISVASTDYKKALKPEQKEWTVQNLGINLEEKPHFTKVGFKKALKRVGSRAKK